jgi:hypothetical protein
MDPQNLSPEQRQAFEVRLRSMNWRTLTTLLMQSVEQHHRPVELPVTIRHWLELNRAAHEATTEEAHAQREAEAVSALMEIGIDAGWGSAVTETLPISGWVISACHFLRDGERWWLFTARRHDDTAPLAGTAAPAPANQLDLKKLGKIIAYAGGNPRRELLRTGALTQQEHDELVAKGRPDVAAYGQIFFWWRAS